MILWEKVGGGENGCGFYLVGMYIFMHKPPTFKAMGLIVSLEKKVKGRSGADRRAGERRREEKGGGSSMAE